MVIGGRLLDENMMTRAVYVHGANELFKRIIGQCYLTLFKFAI